MLKKNKTNLKKSIKAASKKSIAVAEFDAIAIVYAIESDKHPFHHLDRQYSSIELYKVFDNDKLSVILFKIF